MTSKVVNAGLGRRVKAAREARRMSQPELAEIIGMGQSAIAEIEGGRVKRPKKMREIARALKRSEEWLLGETEIEVVPADEDDRPPEADDQLSESGFEGAPRPDVPPGSILEVDARIGMGGGGVMTISRTLSAPTGHTVTAEGIRDWWRLPDHVIQSRFRVPSTRVRIFESNGDSMVPTIEDGDFVFVDVGHRVPSPLGVYALSDPLGGVICKRLEIVSGLGEEPVRLSITSDNPRHAPIERTLDEVSIVGRYLGRLTSA